LWGFVSIKRVAYAANDIFYGNKIPADHYGVMGDNKNNSEDSRVFGPISHEQLVGEAKLIVFSLNTENVLLKKRMFTSL